MTASPIRLLAISGSLRKDSFSTAILRGLKAHVTSHDIDILTLNDVPPYNQDEDGETKPAGVAKLKSAIEQADGLIISSPEYNYGIPGVLKNAIDWASRPGFNSVLKGKTALIITSSPGATGGARAHAPIREALAATGVNVLPRAQATVIEVGKKVADNRLTDEKTLSFLAEGVEDLVREIRRGKA